MKFDITELIGESENNKMDKHAFLIREMRNSKAHFTVARNGNCFSTISATVGSGRERKQKKINLTNAQGKFLFHLPFPDARPLSVDEIMIEAEIPEENKPEIEDIVEELIKLKVIEMVD